MGQKWGPIWGPENDPFWTISTDKDFVNTPAILLESMILGVWDSVHEVLKLVTPQTTKDEAKDDQIWEFGDLGIYAIYVTSDPS